LIGGAAGEIPSFWLEPGIIMGPVGVPPAGPLGCLLLARGFNSSPFGGHATNPKSLMPILHVGGLSCSFSPGEKEKAGFRGFLVFVLGGKKRGTSGLAEKGKSIAQGRPGIGL